MIPKLFEKTATDFSDGNALCYLPDCVSCYVTEERNGEYTLTLKYPLSGTNAYYLSRYSKSNRRIITAIPSPYRKGEQPFRIKKISVGKFDGMITVYAEHISYDLNGFTFISNGSSKYEEITSIAGLFNRMGDAVGSSSKFTFSDYGGGQYLSDTIYFTPNTPKTLRELCGSETGGVLDYCPYATWYWDKYSCQLWPAVGGVPSRCIASESQLLDLDVVFGKNMSTISASFDNSDCYTHVKATTNKISTYSQDVKDNYDALRSYIYPTITGDEAPGSIRILGIDCNSLIDGDITESRADSTLKTYAYRYYRLLTKTPSWSITVGYEDLNNFIGYREWDENKWKYKDKTADLCDSVLVTYKPLGLENERSYISKITTDVLHERYTSITIGELSTSLSRTLSKWG